MQSMDVIGAAAGRVRYKKIDVMLMQDICNMQRRSFKSHCTVHKLKMRSTLNRL